MGRLVVWLFVAASCSAVHAGKQVDTDGIVFDQKTCFDNADWIGYTTAMLGQCGYQLKDSYQDLSAEINKKCIGVFGSKAIGNAVLMGIHSFKADIEEQGRNSACAGVYEEYKKALE